MNSLVTAVRPTLWQAFTVRLKPLSSVFGLKHALYHFVAAFCSEISVSFFFVKYIYTYLPQYKMQAKQVTIW